MDKVQPYKLADKELGITPIRILSQTALPNKHKYEYVCSESNYFFILETVIRSDSDGLYLEVTGYIEAPHRGDELVEDIDNLCQELANINDIRVVHLVECESNAARELFKRVEGYYRIDTGTFHKTFWPVQAEN